MKMNLSKLFLPVMFAAGILLVSCDEEEEVGYSQNWVERATLNPVGDRNVIWTDMGRNLLIESSHLSNYDPAQGQRAFVNYTIKSNPDSSNFNVILNNVVKILTKDVTYLTSENQSEIGDDPVKIYSLWCSGGYLNVNFGFSYGFTATHLINLVENKMIAHPEDGKVYLEFRHNAYNDPQSVARLGTVSFNMARYKNGINEVEFVIRVKEFQGDVEYHIHYDFLLDSDVGDDAKYIGDGFR